MSNQELKFPNVVIWNNIEYRRCIGTVNGYATESGEIWRRSLDGAMVVTKTVEWKTTKGSYLYAKILNLELKYVYKAVHQLVTMAFHGEPVDDGKVYEPNHKDGNKHNNAASNLEWMTRSQNVLHAFESGLCQVGVRVEATNVLTGEVKNYNSLSSIARDWGTSRHLMRTILVRHKENPYGGEWVFKVDQESDKKLRRYQANEIICKNYLTGEIHVFRDASQAEQFTSVQAGTIVTRTRPLARSNKARYSLLAEYVFKRLDDDTPFPEYSKEFAEHSKFRYFTIRTATNRTNNTIEITDLISNTTKIYASRKHFAESIGRSTMYSADMVDEEKIYHGRYKIKFLVKT